MASVKLGTKAVGSIVKMNESGIPVEYLIVQQGKPASGNYDDSCNGTWLRRKDIYSNRQWHTSNVNDYANSAIDSWLNNESSGFLSLLDADIRAAVKTVKIPYRPGSGSSYTVSSGANGLSCKAFLLSMKEVDLTPSYSPTEGAALEYFSGGGNSKRVANLNGSPARWWSRSPYCHYNGVSLACSVEADGSADYWDCSHSYGCCPALILDSELLVSDDGTVSTNEPPTAPGSITASNVVGNQQSTVTLTAATDEDGTIVNYIYEHKVDSGQWTQFSSANSLTATDSIDDSWTTVTYRAKAVDNMGAEGPYVTSEAYTVVHNQPPTAPGSIDVTGVVSGGTATIILTTATDPDGTIASYRYERSVDSGNWTQFASTSDLYTTDHISSDWGTVAYRACAVDDAGTAGPYATSDTKTVNSGWVTIGGPDTALGQRIKPFTLSAVVNVTGATGTPSLTVTCALDGKQVSSQSLTAGSEASIFVDTRVLATGQHTIQITADASDYLPANKAWQFSVPMDELPEGGRAVQFLDDQGRPIFPKTTGQQVIGKNGLSIQNELDNMEKRFKGLTGHLEQVDAVYLASAGAQVEVPREAGEHYTFMPYPSNANGAALVTSGSNAVANIGSDITVTPSADKFTILLSAATASIVVVSKFVVDAEASVTTNPVALFTALDQPHVLSASGGTSETVTDQTDALQTIIDENENANYYILEDTDGNKYYVASGSIINSATSTFTGPCYQDDQATTLYDARTLSLVNTSDVPGLFTELPNTVYSVATQGTAVNIGSNLNETLLAMIEAQPTWNRYAIPGSGGTTYYVLSQNAIESDATSAASVYYCTASGTYYTGGTLSFAESIDTLAVGDTIKIKENGTLVEFKIIHKGSPSAAYVGFDNGVVVLRQDIHSKGIYDSSNNDYANSDLNEWGNGTYLNTIDEAVRNKILSVKIPYRPGTSGSVSAGANGLSCKVFFLSTKEVDSTKSYSPNEGAVFSYFKGGGNSKRIARYNGQPDYWWLRSPTSSTGGDFLACLVKPGGDVDSYNGDGVMGRSYGRRPAFVLPNTIGVANDGTVIG